VLIAKGDWTTLRCLKTLQAGSHEKAVALMEAQGWWQRLAEFANNLDSPGGDAGLRAAAAAFGRADREVDAEACLRRLADAKVLDAPV
jgi:hypothetical protein